MPRQLLNIKKKNLFINFNEIKKEKIKKKIKNNKIHLIHFEHAKTQSQSRNLELEFMPTFLTNPDKLDKLNMNP